MREIMFRGKMDDGEWMYGSFCMDAREQLNGLCGVDGFIRLYDKTKGKMQTYEVDRETVGQYTGLKDKYGKRIFEGDIVLGLFHYELAAKGVVTFRDGAFGLRWNRGKVREFSAFTSICNVDYKVIGNIHENPELLDEKGGEG